MVSHTASQIVSLGKGGELGDTGSVNVNANGNTTLTGSSVMAPGGDITVSGANVVINEVHNTTVESRCSAVAVGSVCRLPPLSSGGARVTSP